MLRYFIERADLQQVNYICKQLNEVKNRLYLNDFDNPQKELELCNVSFEEIFTIAENENNEKLANSNYVFKCYFLLFCHLMSYFSLLQERSYKSSWSRLQDCIDDIQYIGKFAEDRLELPVILELLLKYENMYPYKVFASSEYVISKSHCSICGESMQSLACSHIKGNLYWGKPAIEHIDEIKTIQAVCLVSHPEDKRCIIEPSDDDRPESEKFKKLDEVLKLGLPFLQMFEIDSKIETRRNKSIAGRNDKCPCGSGIKYKKCCGKDIYYQHERNIITPKEKIKLVKIELVSEVL